MNEANIAPVDRIPAPAGMRRWLFRLVALAALALVLVLAAPLLISSGPVTKLLLHYINADLPGKIASDDLSLSWFRGQSISGLRLIAPEGETVFEIASLKLPETPLWRLLVNRGDLGTIRLEGLVANISQYEDGTTNLERALLRPAAAAKSASSAGLPANLKARIEMINGRATFSAPGMTAVQANDVNAIFEAVGLRQLSATLNARLQHGAENGAVEVRAKANDLLAADGALQMDKADWEADVALRRMPTEVIDCLMGRGGALTALLGAFFAATLKAGRQTDAGELAAAPIALLLQAQAPNLEAAFSGQIANGVLEIAPGSALKAALTPEAVAAFAKTHPSLADFFGSRNLAGPASVSLKFERTLVPLANFKAEAVQAGMEMAIDRIALTGEAGLAGFELRDASIKMPATALNQHLQLAFSAKTICANQTGSIQAEAEVAGLLTEAPVFSGQVAIDKWPVAILDFIAGQDGRLLPILGTMLEHVEVRLVPDATAPATAAFIIKAQTPNLKASLVGRYHPSALAMESGSLLDFALTPQAWMSMQSAWLPRGEKAGGITRQGEQQALALEGVAKAQMIIKECQIGFAPKAISDGEQSWLKFAPQRTRLDTTLVVQDATFSRPADRQRARVRNLAIRLTTANPAELVELNAVADIAVSAGAALSEASRLTSSTRISGLLDSKGNLAWQQIKAHTDTQAVALPIAVLDAVFGLGGKLTAVVGATAGATLKASYGAAAGGMFDLAVAGDNLNADIQGAIAENLTLRLREPAALSLAITPEIAALVLAKINPMFINAIGPKNAGERLTCIINKEFAFDLKTLAVQSLNAQADIRVPELRMKSGWGIGGFLKLLAALDAVGETRANFTASFTPLAVNVANGIVSTNDFWLASDDLAPGRAIALGTKVDAIDLAAQQAKIAMGISGQTLRLVPIMSSVIRQDYIYEVSLSGPLAGIEPNYSEFLKEILLVKAKAEAIKRVGEKSLVAAVLAKEISRMIPQAKDQDSLAQRWRQRPKQPAPNAGGAAAQPP